MPMPAAPGAGATQMDEGQMDHMTMNHGQMAAGEHAVLYAHNARYVSPGWISHLRVSRDGKRVLFLEHPIDGDDRGAVKRLEPDGSVRILSTPGHTPGHQSLQVRLRTTGTVVLSGDLVHFQENWDARRAPAFNSSVDQTKASMQRVAEILERERARLWINHDKAQRDKLNLSPAYYD